MRVWRPRPEPDSPIQLPDSGDFCRVRVIVRTRIGARSAVARIAGLATLSAVTLARITGTLTASVKIPTIAPGEESAAVAVDNKDALEATQIRILGPAYMHWDWRAYGSPGRRMGQLPPGKAARMRQGTDGRLS
jgi:hypothetical protein